MSSDTTHLIALSTYGTQTKTRQGSRLSALKIGYTNAVAEVLLALISTARNISTKRDSYVYIHLPNKPKLHQDWLFVEATDEELARAEMITMSNPSSRGIAVWRDSSWLLFPCLENPEYHEATSNYDTPKGSPHGYWSINSSGEKSATGGGNNRDALIAEYSKLDPNKSAWWWIPGNDATYEHRGALKRAGCRWRRKRRAYSYIGDKLPESLLELLDNEAECRAIMAGMNPEEAKLRYRHSKVSSDIEDEPAESTSIEHLIDTILRDNIKTINTDGQFPLLMTVDDIGAGQDLLGINEQQRMWYLFGSPSTAQIHTIHATDAEWSTETRRWLFKDDDHIAALDAFLATLNIETDSREEDSEPCSIDEAAAALGLSVHRDEPSSAYERGRTAWTTRNLPADIEGRESIIPQGTKYTIREIDFSGESTNPVYIVELEDGHIVRILEEELLPQRLFSIGQTVYARHESETSAGKRIPTGHQGTITRLYRFSPNLGQLRGHTYDVEWEGLGEEWMFEDELAAEPNVSGISITRRSVISFGGEGSSSSDERKAIIERGAKPAVLDMPPLKQYNCSCEEYAGPKGWIPAENLGTWIACGMCNPDGTQIPQSDPTNPDAEKPPAVRMIKATKLTEDSSTDDEITHAIRHASKVPIHSEVLNRPSDMNSQIIPMAYVGELTGSVIAHVFCYGYATDAGELIYLNMGGPRSGVEAIRAKLGKGEAINLIPDDAPAIELGAGEGNTGMYSAIMSNMSEVRFVHCILVHEKITDPNYNGKATTYIIEVNQTQAKGQLLHHIRETVNLPVFDEWIDYLWQAGQTAMLVRNCRAGGGVRIKSVSLDKDSWKRLITGGVAEEIISIPRKETA